MTIENHPLAAMFPLLEGKEFSDLIISIKSNGLRDTITLYEGKILDGRNRYRACIEAGIEPRTEPLPDGQDPLQFVYIKNVTRRHLTVSQRALAVAQFSALLKRGNVAAQCDGSAGAITMTQAAQRAEVSTASLKRAKNVLANGTDAEIASVKNGERNVRAVDDDIRARRRGKKKPAAPKPKAKAKASIGYRIPVPAGFTCLSDAVRAGVEHERGGSRADALKHSGLAVQTYLAARDIILLQQRDDLSTSDAEIVRCALQELDDTRTIKRAAELIRPISLKVWGRKGNRFKSDKTRAEKFGNQIFYVVSACTSASEMEIPHIDETQRAEALTSLDEAIAALHTLQKRVKGGGS